MKRHINSPYKMNWKMYGLIGGISVLIMIIAVICNDNTDSLISDIVKNLAFGCVASTIVALLIEIGNIKEQNDKATSVYDAVYMDLKFQISWYVETWERLCSVAFKDEDYCQEKHTWIEWYEITKSKFAECDDNRQAELMQFFTSFGKTETVPENLMDAVTAASGSYLEEVKDIYLTDEPSYNKSGLKSSYKVEGNKITITLEGSAEDIKAAAINNNEEALIKIDKTVEEYRKDIISDGYTCK